MNKLLEKLCEVAEKINPNFDRNNGKDLDDVAKTFILSNEKNTNFKEDYLRIVVEGCQQQKIEEEIKKFGTKVVELELKVLNLEKEILERKITTTKKFMN